MVVVRWTTWDILRLARKAIRVSSEWALLSFMGSSFNRKTNDLRSHRYTFDVSLFTCHSVYLAMDRIIPAAYEQAGPVFHSINYNDTVVCVANIACIDRDLDVNDPGGKLVWKATVEVLMAMHYVVDWATSPSVVVRSQECIIVQVDIDLAHIPVNTIDGPSNYKRIGFYTKSTLLEQTTPGSFPIIDSISVVSNVSFVGRDFDGAELDHTVTWFEAGEVSLVMYCFVYLVIDSISWGVSRIGDDVAGGAAWIGIYQIGDDVAVRTTPIDISADTVQLIYKYTFVRTKSRLAEHTTSADLHISVSIESVSSIAFADRDFKVR